MRFPTHDPALAVDGECDLVGRLMLIEAVAGQHASMPGDEVHRVFNLDAGEKLVRGIDHQPVDWSHEPLARVKHVRQGILDRAALGAVGVVGCPVCGPIRGKVLSARGHNLHRSSEATALNRFSHRGKRRIRTIDVGYGRDQIVFFDAAVTSSLRPAWVVLVAFRSAGAARRSELRGLRNVQVCRGCDDRGRERPFASLMPLECTAQISKRMHLVSICNPGADRWV